MRLFDILGPVMVGPSQQPHGGAVRIGLTAANCSATGRCTRTFRCTAASP